MCAIGDMAKDSVLKGSASLPDCTSDLPHIDMRVRNAPMKYILGGNEVSFRWKDRID